MIEKECRRTSPGHAAVRLEDAGCKHPKIRGYASVFYQEGDQDTEYRYGPFVERIAPTAFKRALEEKQAVVALFNHEPDHVLGKTTAGTLSLATDDVGLRYEINLPNTQAGRDVAELVARGDLDGSSFSFYATKVSWEEGEENDIRTIEDVDLVDVGPVTFAAYAASSVEAASRERDQWRHKMQVEKAKAILQRTKDALQL